MHVTASTRCIAVATVLVLTAMAILTVIASPADAHQYAYTTTLKVCDASVPSNCADRDAGTINTTDFTAGSNIVVEFNLTTDDSAGHDWLVPAGKTKWEDNRDFEVAIVSTHPFVGCYTSRFAQNSPLVRTGSTNPGVLDGKLAAAEGATHTAEPVIGGIKLQLVSASTGSVNTMTDVVTTNADGKFKATATLPNPFPPAFQNGQAKICVESVDLYGDEGNVELDGNNDGDYNDPDDIRTGVGIHCDSLPSPLNTTCFQRPFGTPMKSDDPMCTTCYTYNSTPRITNEEVRVNIKP